MRSTHGITQTDRHTHLNFGIIKLFDALVIVTKESGPRSEWADRFQSNVFSHRLEHFRQCVSKFDRAAHHVDRCLKKATPYLEKEYKIARNLAEQKDAGNAAGPIIDYELTAAKLTAYHGSGFDLPLYFDLMLFYLRIQTDSYAGLSSFLMRQLSSPMSE